MKRPSLLLLLTYVLVISCTNDSAELPPPVSYANDIFPIVQTHCFGTGGQSCHVTNSNMGSNGDYTTYAGLKAKVDNGSLQIRALTPGGGMPPSYSNGPQLGAEDLRKLRVWVANGAPNN